MSESPFRRALAPLAARLPKTVQEHEVLRVAATLRAINPANAAEAARKHILAWAQNRCGGRLPQEAWEGASFEYFSGGRNSTGIRLQDPEADIWTLRTDDPDKTVPGRVWTTEIALGGSGTRSCQFSARLLVSTSESDLEIEPHTPGFIQQLVERCGLSIGEYELTHGPWLVDSASATDQLVEMLVDTDRKLPVYVCSLMESGPDFGKPRVDVLALSRAILGLGHVVLLTPEGTWTLTQKFGRLLSVFGGAVRSYLPGFDTGSRPYDHRLFLADRLGTDFDQWQCVKWIRRQAAAESIRNVRLGKDALAFASIKSASIQAREQRLVSEGATDAEKLSAAQDHIEALKQEIEQASTMIDYFDSEHKIVDERAKVAEEQLRWHAFRIQQLEECLLAGSDPREKSIVIPTYWDGFANWCDENLSGRIALTPTARRAVRSPEFADPAVVGRCLSWLASTCRDQRLGRLESTLRDELVESGVYNSPGGSDTFDFDWNSRRLTADWHIKNGGNTRDPTRCLRIYYSWDEDTRQIIIARMPAHKRSGAT